MEIPKGLTERRGHSLSRGFDQIERGQLTLEAIAENWHTLSLETQLTIMWVVWRGSAGRREYEGYQDPAIRLTMPDNFFSPVVDDNDTYK